MIQNTRTWADFSSCTSTNQKSNPTISSPLQVSLLDDNKSKQALSSSKNFANSETTIAQQRDSTDGCPRWSVSSLLAVLPDSPSPICSSSTSLHSPRSHSISSDVFYSLVSTEFSTPRNQSYCALSNASMLSSSCVEIDEWIDNAKCCFNQPSFQRKEDEGMKSLSTSTAYKSASTAIDDEIQSVKFPSIDEKMRLKSNLELMQSSCGASEAGSSINGHNGLMTRPKPYHEFLDEIQRQEAEAQINAWKKAKQRKYMDRLRRKEAAISDWELKQTRKVMNEMKKLQSKLEAKRTRALDKTQKKILRVQKKAEEKKAGERRFTVNKMSEITEVSDKIQAPKSLVCFNLTRLC